MKHKSLRALEESVAAKIAAQKRAAEEDGIWGTEALNPNFRAMCRQLFNVPDKRGRMRLDDLDDSS